MSPTCLGSSPNDRVLMMGLAGFEFTSASGKKFQCTPKAMACGKLVVPSRRVVTPRSKSAANSNGSLDSFCMRFSNSAASYGSLRRKEGAVDVNGHGKGSHVIFVHVLEP